MRVNESARGGKKRRIGGAELILASLVISVVAMMIVPLPTWLLDVLLATNLSLSVAILLVVLYVPDALAIATFPTVLLLTTLFRLALNVSTSRLILLQANAGEVIFAFGNFVVRGNYVVGAVVFLILTIIQFIVIAKGSERVAEVGARFVLDAMPGKQMAIDAELRSGSIDGNEARRRRRALARESQFYGSMDGAMKFVKGDVIASLVITAVNIVGGLAIGVGQRGMPVTDALKRYGLLTIGDGLVSQIPALILSTAAGVLVTRTASEEPDTPLGEEISRQLFGMPKALLVASIFVLGLAVVPGLPAAPFLVLGVALFWVARAREKQIDRAAKASVTEPTRDAKRGPQFAPLVVPWAIDVSPDLEGLLDDTPQGPGIRSRALALRSSIFGELGVPLPSPVVRVSTELNAGTVALSLFEVPTRLFAVSADENAVAGLSAEIERQLEARASDFLGLTETQRLLDTLEEFSPATVRNVVPKPISVTVLCDILKRLVEERVSIRDLGRILEALATVGASERDPLNLAEYVRSQLRRPITFKLTRGAQQLGVVLLDPMIEDTVRKAITRTAAGAFLALPPDAARDIVASIKRARSEANQADVAILTQPDIRRFVKKVLDTDIPDATVVSFADLVPELNLRPLARAHLSGL